MGKPKLSFEEVATKIKDFNSDYELIEYKNNATMLLKYIPLNEYFISTLRWFLEGKSHAPSIKTRIKQEKYSKTCLEKYGYTNVSQVDSVKKKKEKVSLEKYGCKNVAQNKAVKDKIKATNLEKYGTECANQNKDIRQKIKDTHFTKYGYDYPYQNEDTRLKMLNSHYDKYEGSFATQTEDVKRKIRDSREENGSLRVINGKTVAEIASDKGMSYSYFNYLDKEGVDIESFAKESGTMIEQKIETLLF
jgi:hypothetical protein